MIMLNNSRVSDRRMTCNEKTGQWEVGQTPDLTGLHLEDENEPEVPTRRFRNLPEQAQDPPWK